MLSQAAPAVIDHVPAQRLGSHFIDCREKPYAVSAGDAPEVFSGAVA
jgi:hypothetical protein